MATMAMATVKNINNKKSVIAGLLSLMITSTTVLGGDWQFTPSLGLDSTFTDNVELTITEPTSSYVTQTIAGIEAAYKSSVASISLTGTKSYALYSHDSNLNSDYRTLNGSGDYSFWRGGPTLIATASIVNQSRSNASNSLADLVSGDTIESQNYSTGIQYNFGNSSYSVESAIIYRINRYEDNISESDTLTAQFSSKNGNAARHIYWQLSTDYTKREGIPNGINNVNNVNNDGKNYVIDTLIGAITPLNLNPFIRFYDEDVKGSGVIRDLQTTSSWGPGLRWLASKHVTIDISYNFVNDETISDDYIAASLQWEPSARTSLTAGFSQRFFGDSYNLNFQHKTKRLSNSITYIESLNVFDRNNYQEIDPDNIELVESNEFSLNRRFVWTSTLELSRTLFNINVSASEREGLESNVKDDTFDTSLTITRKTGAKSSLSLLTMYNYLIFDKDNPEGSRQEDHYRTISAIFTKNIASSLSANFTVQHVTRDSSVDQFSYDEMRAVINITKEF